MSKKFVSLLKNNDCTILADFFSKAKLVTKLDIFIHAQDEFLEQQYDFFIPVDEALKFMASKLGVELDRLFSTKSFRDILLNHFGRIENSKFTAFSNEVFPLTAKKVDTVPYNKVNGTSFKFSTAIGVLATSVQVQRLKIELFEPAKIMPDVIQPKKKTAAKPKVNKFAKTGRPFQVGDIVYDEKWNSRGQSDLGHKIIFGRVDKITPTGKLNITLLQKEEGDTIQGPMIQTEVFPLNISEQKKVLVDADGNNTKQHLFFELYNPEIQLYDEDPSPEVSIAY